MSETFKARKVVGPNAEHVTNVTLNEGRHISSSPSRVRDVKVVEIQTVQGKESPMLMVLKDYSNTLDPELLSKVEENYKRCRDAGLKVFATYRIDRDRRQILMTYLNRGNRVAISSNNSSADAPSGKFIEYIVNMREFIAALYQEATKAADNNIYLPWDAYLFLTSVGNSKDHTLDFLVGDYDLVSTTSARTRVDLRKDNLREAKRAISEFSTKYLVENTPNKRALNLISREYTTFRKIFGIR